jgi:hypothetical protein
MTGQKMNETVTT